MVLINKERMISVSPYSKPKSKPATKRTEMTTNHESDENSKVKVFVRVRPFSAKEINCGCKNVINVVDTKTMVFDPKETNEPFFFHGIPQKGRDINKKANKDMLFEFDRVFSEEIPNHEVFNATTKSIVKSIFEGYNCSVFAYGATGAGKTFTMLGTEDHPGITFLTIVELLKQIENSIEGTNVTLGASYIEVYNENVRDLLHPNAGILQLREDDGRVAISGLEVEKITSSNHLFSLLATGNQNRSQHPTDSNLESSRSHAIFQVHVRMEQGTTFKLAKLSMIDLAGSERGSATGFRGARFKEGSNINKSLLALGNCINSLAEGLKHVPYRDSKLTRILKDSLGGNCQTLMIANVSPSSNSFEDTYNTLKYATRAKCIKSKISKNILNETYSIAHYKKMVTDLQSKIYILENRSTPVEVDEWIERIRKVMEEKTNTHKEMLSLKSQERLTEFRITQKMNALAIGDPNVSLTSAQNISRLNNGVCQLKARAESIKNRLEEYKPKLEAIEEMFNRLVSDIGKNEKLAAYLKPTLELYEERLNRIQESHISMHLDKIIQLQTKQEETLSTAMTSVFPILKEFYSLLRGFGHVTNEISSKYEDALKRIDGIKAVAWIDDEDVIRNDNPNLRLSLTLLQVRPLDTGPPSRYAVQPYSVLKENNNNKRMFRQANISSHNHIKSVMPLSKSKTFIKSTCTKEAPKLPTIGTPKSKLSSANSFKLKTKGPQFRTHPYQNKGSVRLDVKSKSRLLFPSKTGLR